MTDAIILKTAPYSETTLLVTLLTREHGVVRALAKGARRERYNVQAAFEPFALIACSLRVKGHDALGTMHGPDLKESWDYLRYDVDRLAYAGLGIEALGGLATHSAPDPRFFDEAAEFLETLGRVAAPGSLTIALLIRLLFAAGFPPHLAGPWTEATLPPSLTYHFESGRFEEPLANDSRHSMRLPRAAVAAVMKYFETPPPLDGSFVVGAQNGAVLLRWLIRVWQDHLNEPLKAGRFFEKMIGEQTG